MASRFRAAPSSAPNTSTFNQPIAALYHYDNATRQVRELLGGQTCSNGKYLHDGLLVDIDTQPKTITEYRYDGALHPLRLIAPPESLPAPPDGMRPMPGGESVVVAYYNPAQVADGVAQEIRLSDGQVLTELVLPGSPSRHLPGSVGPGWRDLRLLHHCGGRHARRRRAPSRRKQGRFSWPRWILREAPYELESTRVCFGAGRRAGHRPAAPPSRRSPGSGRSAAWARSI